MATDELVKLDGWSKGVDNVREEYDLDKKSLRKALNVDITGSGKLRRRDGYSLLVAGTDVHSLWSYGDTVLFVADGALKYMQAGIWVAQELLTGFSADPVSYEGLGQYVYFTNGTLFGRVDTLGATASFGWGVADPGGQPTATAVNYGGLSEGTYQIAVTFRSTDGLESGSTLAVAVAVEAGGGVQLTDIPQGDGATVRVYASTANGTSEELWFHSEYAMGTTEAFLTKVTSGKPLVTQHLEALPPGQLIRRFQGRLYVAQGSFLLFSDPLRFHLWAADDNYIVFPERITALEPTHDGLYVVAGKTYFLAGTDPKQFHLREVAPTGAAEGTGTQVPGVVFPDLKTAHPVAYWFSERGPVVGMPGGQIVYLLDGRIAVNQYLRGSTLLREQHGVRQLITTLQGPGASSGFAATDSSAMTVYRNGVEV